MQGARIDHPLVPFLLSADPVHSASLDVLEDLLQAVQSADPLRWQGKRRDFRQLRTEQAYLSWRDELAIAAMLARNGVGFEFGDTSSSNPDIVLAGGLGIEITAKAPDSIRTLHDELEEAMLSHPAHSARLRFSSYPVRITPDARDQVITGARALASQASAAGQDGTFRVTVTDPANHSPLNITVQVTSGSAFGPGFQVTWEVDAGPLGAPLQGVLDQVISILRDDRKAAQAQRRPTILVADIARLGAGWIRPIRIWAQMLKPEIPTSCPFAAIAVMIPRLDQAVPELAVQAAPAASDNDLSMIRELTAAIGLS